MFRTLRNAWKIVDLRKKILYTLFIILIFPHRFRYFGAVCGCGRFGRRYGGQQHRSRSILTLMSGGGFSDASIFAPVHHPLYINASIIIQLLTVAIPPGADG